MIRESGIANPEFGIPRGAAGRRDPTEDDSKSGQSTRSTPRRRSDQSLFRKGERGASAPCHRGPSLAGQGADAPARQDLPLPEQIVRPSRPARLPRPMGSPNQDLKNRFRASRPDSHTTGTGAAAPRLSTRVTPRSGRATHSSTIRCNCTPFVVQREATPCSFADSEQRRITHPGGPGSALVVSVGGDSRPASFRWRPAPC